jgi:hypothetical protein
VPLLCGEVGKIFEVGRFLEDIRSSRKSLLAEQKL